MRRMPRSARWLGPLVAAAILAGGLFLQRRRPARAPAPAPEAAEGAPPRPAPLPELRGLPFDLVEESARAGLVFTHRKASFSSKLANLMPWLTAVGASVAVADVDQDGRPDILVTSSAVGSRPALFHNNGDGTFTDVTARSGLSGMNRVTGSGRALFFDWDNDGYPDLIVTYGCSKAYHNNGDGTFTDVTVQAGLAGDCNVSYASNAIDVDGDGYLDYVKADYFKDINLIHPRRFDFMQDSLTDADNGGALKVYRNDGKGHFHLVPGNFGIRSRGWTQAVGVWDVDGDGRPDLYIANDYGDDQLFLNKPGGFQDASASLHNKYSRTGMNADFAYLDGDDRPSIFVSHIYTPPYEMGGNTLWTWPAGGGRPAERAGELGVSACGWSWGAKFVDLDLDGRQDLVVANGFVSADPKKSYWYGMSLVAGSERSVMADARNWPPMGDASLAGYERKCVYWNSGRGFVEIGARTGMKDDRLDGRGLAVIDARGDGRVALLEATQGGPLRYYQSVPPPGNRWVGVSLVGSAAHRLTWGSRVRLR
ncbi:MAG: VCBS repeat-containing protein, partial [Elusimicrobia bacterium]|nr:VCBS repeat-containing protein [Elusimicrobiota bacterium]